MKSPFVLILGLILILSSYSQSQNNPWKNIGPFMGYINDLALDENHIDTVYAATPYGVYISTDQAEKWIKTGLTDVEIYSVAISQLDPKLLIAHSENTVFKSDDYGENWEIIFESNIKSIGAIAFDPKNNESIWVGVNVGITDYSANLFHTMNGGNNWDEVFFGDEGEYKLQSVLSIYFDLNNGSVIYACGYGDTHNVDGGIFVSKDDGDTWTNSRPGGCSSNNVLGVLTTPKDYEPHAAFIIVDACQTYRKFFKSIDYGITWDELHMPTYTEITIDRDYLYPKVNAMAVYPALNRIYFGANYENQSSLMSYDYTDDSWHYSPGSPLKNPTAVILNPDIWYIGFDDEGVYRYSGSDSEWVRKNIGMNDVKIFDLECYPDNPDKLIASIDGAILKTKNAGDSWEEITGEYQSIELNPLDTSILFAGKGRSVYPNFMDPYYCYTSNNSGTSWSSEKLFSRGGSSDYSYVMWTGDILAFEGNTDIVLVGVDGGGGCGEGLYKSIDGGENWDRKFSTGVSSIAADPTNNEKVYLGTTNSGEVYLSENSGSSWTKISQNLDDNVWDIEVDNNGQVFAATSSGLYKWEGNTNWSVLQGLSSQKINTLLIDNHANTSVLYIGVEDQGIWISDDGGTNWESFNEGLDKMNITKLDMNNSYPRKLYAGTKDGGIWVTTIAESGTNISSVTNSTNSINIYPNPSNGIFKLKADKKNIKKIEIFNSTGIKIKSILNPEYVVTFMMDLSDYESGIYFIRTQCEKTYTNKLIIK